MGVLVITVMAQRDLTSDARRVPRMLYAAEAGLPTPRPLFVAPQISVFKEFRTNDLPLVVQRTITSNVVQRTVWVDGSTWNTNDLVLASNVVSVVTNSVP